MVVRMTSFVHTHLRPWLTSVQMIRDGRTVLQGNIAQNNPFHPEDTAIVSRIVGLQECAYKQITGEACTLCDDIVSFTAYIRQEFPAIRWLQTYTDNYIPDGTYGIWETIPPNLLMFAFTGTSVFETLLHAVPARDYDVEAYRSAQERYTCVESKAEATFPYTLAGSIVCAMEHVPLTFQDVEVLFDSSQTWPEFVRRVDGALQALNVPLNERFSFFRYWLPSFVNSVAEVPGAWMWRV